MHSSDWDYAFTVTDFAALIFRSFKQIAEGGVVIFSSLCDMLAVKEDMEFASLGSVATEKQAGDLAHSHWLGTSQAQDAQATRSGKTKPAICNAIQKS